MRENFNKFKVKIIIEVLIKSLLYGFCIGLLSIAVPLIIIKLKKIDFEVLYLIIIGINVMSIASGLIFLIFKPNDKKIAIRLDKELNLNQKVLTMIEFEQSENDMVILQRENTNDILSKISLKNLTMKFSVFLFVFIAIALSFTITAFAIPNESNPGPVGPPPIVDPDYDADDWTIQAIQDLIEEVQAADINTNLKTKYVDSLNQLIEVIMDATKESQMKEYVLSTIDNVLLELDKTNTNNEIYLVLRESTYTLVYTLGGEINNYNLVNVENALSSFRILISGSSQAITELDKDFGSLIKKSQLDLKEELVASIIKFSDAINNCAKENDVNSAVINAINTHVPSVINALTKQKNNQEIANLIENRLLTIFGLHENDDDNNDDDVNPGNNSTDDTGKLPPNQTGSGGMGTGEVLFGGNDSFFDPENGEVKYGDVITAYYGLVVGRIEEGIIEEDLREMFNYYFDILFGKKQSEE